MRRRLTIAILGTVLATLVMAGLGTLALAGATARQQTEEELRDQADATASILNVRRVAADPDNPRILLREQFNRVRNALEVDDLALIVLDADDQIGPTLSDPLPAGLSVEDLDPAALRDGEIVSGSFDGNNVFAAAPLTDSGASLGVVVLTRSVERAVGPAFGWFLLASGITIAIGAVVSYRLAKQLTKPLREATAVTAQIAQGDLAARLPVSESARRDELAELSRSINQMAGTLQRSRGMEQQFLLSVSHDLRTPLTSIRGYAEAVADGTAPDARAAALVILAEARRLERLVKDLLELGRLEARQFRLDLVPVDLSSVARGGTEGFVPEATGAGLVIEVIAPDAPVLVNGDPDRVGQVLANLVENAMKFAASRIEVRVVDHPLGPRLEVADDGPGIDAEDLPHVFERLYVTTYEPVRKESGSGLGLAIVRELVEAMGGHVTAAAEDGGGTRMVAVFRSAAAPTVAPGAPPRPLQPF